MRIAVIALVLCLFAVTALAEQSFSARIEIDGGECYLTWNSEAAYRYRVWSSERDLIRPRWLPGEWIVGVDGEMTVVLSTDGNRQCLYTVERRRIQGE